MRMSSRLIPMGFEIDRLPLGAVLVPCRRGNGVSFGSEERNLSAILQGRRQLIGNTQTTPEFVVPRVPSAGGVGTLACGSSRQDIAALVPSVMEESATASPA